MSEAEAAEPVRDYWLERLIMLSDGVFAIAITLMAIEVHPPHGWDGAWETLWRGSWQTLGAYGVSFAAIGAYWMGHRRLFAHIRRADTPLSLLNLLVLGLIALLPATAELIYTYGPRDVALQVYVGLIGLIGVAQALMWGYASLVGKLVADHVPAGVRFSNFLVMLVTPFVVASAVIYNMVSGTWWSLLALAVFMVVVARVRRQLVKYEVRR